MGTGSFPGVKSGRGPTVTPHSLLVPWSWKSRAIPLLPLWTVLWTVRPVQSLSACTRVTFTFFWLFGIAYCFVCNAWSYAADISLPVPASTHPLDRHRNVSSSLIRPLSTLITNRPSITLLSHVFLRTLLILVVYVLLSSFLLLQLSFVCLNL